MKSYRKMVSVACLAVAGLVEIADHVDTISSHLPKAVAMHSQEFIFAVLICLCIYLLTTHSDGESQESKGVHSASIIPTGGTATASPIVEASPVVTTNPVQIANPVQHVTVFSHPPPIHRAPPVTPSRTLKHNVQHVGNRILSSDPNNPLMLVSCFENVPIPGEQIADFNYVKAKISYESSNGLQTTIFPAAWADSDSAIIDFESGPTHCLVVAAYVQGAWKICRAVENKNYWDGITYSIEQEEMPNDVFKAMITLIGGHNVSLAPVTVEFYVGKDGAGSFKPQ